MEYGIYDGDSHEISFTRPNKFACTLESNRKVHVLFQLQIGNLRSSDSHYCRACLNLSNRRANFFSRPFFFQAYVRIEIASNARR